MFYRDLMNLISVVIVFIFVATVLVWIGGFL